MLLFTTIALCTVDLNNLGKVVSGVETMISIQHNI